MLPSDGNSESGLSKNSNFGAILCDYPKCYFSWHRVSPKNCIVILPNCFSELPYFSTPFPNFSSQFFFVHFRLACMLSYIISPLLTCVLELYCRVQMLAHGHTLYFLALCRISLGQSFGLVLLYPSCIVCVCGMLALICSNDVHSSHVVAINLYNFSLLPLSSKFRQNKEFEKLPWQLTCLRIANRFTPNVAQYYVDIIQIITWSQLPSDHYNWG